MIPTPTPWTPEDSGTVTTDNADVVRTLQDGTIRLEEDGTERVLQENVVSGKTPTTWTEEEQ